jgi:hypothetical protein
MACRGSLRSARHPVQHTGRKLGNVISGKRGGHPFLAVAPFALVGNVPELHGCVFLDQFYNYF